MTRRILRALHDFFLGPVDGDPWEQNRVRLCSALLVLTGPVAYVVRGFL